MGADSASAAAGSAAIEWRGVVKDFACGLRGLKVRAVDSLSLRVEPGQVYGLLGPNGSGKSTAIKLVLGLLRPTAGGCTLFGVASDRLEARREVGYLPETPNFHRYLSGRELVRFYARICGLRGTAMEKRVADVIATVGLAAAEDRAVGSYSKGMLQRIGLAQALVHDPRVLILDEPTAGVDPGGAAAIVHLIQELKAQGKTVLITSHLLAQMEEICDRIALLDRGRLVIEGAVADLVGAAEQEGLAVGSLTPAEKAELSAWLAGRGKTVEVRPLPRMRLERLFLEKTGKG